MYDLFSLPPVKFPRNFLWGSATAGHQIEGDNIHSQMWHAEQQGELHDPNGCVYPIPEKSGMACNAYRMFREDDAMIQQLGHQAYRFSIEWSRIEPAEGVWDEQALKHYITQLEDLRERSIKCCVTLVHIAVPQWFHAAGGFHQSENLKYFERYVRYIVPKITPYVDLWNVLNEAFSFVKSYQAASVNAIRAHARAYHIIKQHSQAPVSSAHMALQHYPNRFYDPLDNLMAQTLDFRQHGMLLHAIRNGEIIGPEMDAVSCPEAKNAMDFWSLNIYTRNLVDSRNANLSAPRFPHKKLRLIDADFYFEEMYPEGTTAMLERFADRPVYITENGCSSDDDRFRIVYMALTFSALNDAIRRGVDLKGYFYWSLMDNFEWGSFKPRFGLVNVDLNTFERTPKPSALFYREVIERNGFDQTMLRKYLTEMPSLAKKY